MNDINDTCKVLKKYIKNTFKGYNAQQIRDYCKKYCEGRNCGNCMFTLHKYDSACMMACNNLIIVRRKIKNKNHTFNKNMIDINNKLGIKIFNLLKIILLSKKFKNIENEYYKIKDDNIKDLFSSNMFGGSSIFCNALEKIIMEE